MCIRKYPAHPYCKHPDKRTAIGSDWTQQIEIEFCDDAWLANRHARRRGSEVICDPADWQAVVNPDLFVYCESCQDGDSQWSATNMLVDFEVKRDQWQYTGLLDDSELSDIQRDIDRARVQHEQEANGPRGPYNNSYYVLVDALETYTAYWEKYLKEKKEFKENQDEEMRTKEAWRLARLANRVDEALETSMYPPGYLAQAEASRSQDESRQYNRPPKPNRLAEFLTGKRHPKKK